MSTICFSQYVNDLDKLTPTTIAAKDSVNIYAEALNGSSALTPYKIPLDTLFALFQDFHAYGKMVSSNLTGDVYSLTADTWTLVDNWNDGGGNNITFSADSLKIGAGYSGLYYVSLFADISVDATDDTVFVGISKNGSDPATYAYSLRMSKFADRVYNSTMLNLPTLQENDVLRVMIKCNDADDVTIYRCNFVVFSLYLDWN